MLEGTIQRWGDYIRVTVRLISIPSGAALWAGTFDEKFTDIFAVQDAIAERVAGSLALELNSEERRRLTKRYSENTDAYELYLKGRYHRLGSCFGMTGIGPKRSVILAAPWNLILTTQIVILVIRTYFQTQDATRKRSPK